MKRFSLIIVIIMAFSFNSCEASSKKHFLDISGHWAEDEIIIATVDEKIDGYEDETFRPDNKVTIAEFIKILIKYSNFDLIRSGDNIWPDFYIETAKVHELLSDEFSNYNLDITRYEAARILANHIDVSKLSSSANIFSDLDKKYKKEILKLAKIGIVKGYEDHTFRGDNRGN